jgi:alkanesulfonate monooxygenase SsuD/methylene tetrahydromethanopterin reductase-like flavin-dependent oxidoreductase (luciferase family)
MRLGVGPISLRGATRQTLEGLAAKATASSFDAVWVSESRADGVGGGLAAAAMLGQVVPIRVGAAVDAGLYHPLYLAEDIAIADLTSQGRIEVLLRLATSASERYESSDEQSWFEEQLHVFAAALSGAHIQWSGEHLRVPARIEANQPAPERLALNPRPAQPAVPIWLESSERWMDDLARRFGFGVAERLGHGVKVPPPTGRWPGMLLCQPDVEPKELLDATGDRAGYFVIGAQTPDEVVTAGRGLIGAIRMPDFPEWINA